MGIVVIVGNKNKSLAVNTEVEKCRTDHGSDQEPELSHFKEALLETNSDVYQLKH